MPGQSQPVPWNCTGASPPLTPQTPQVFISMSYTPKGTVTIKPQYSFLTPVGFGFGRLASPLLPPAPPSSGIVRSMASVHAPPGVIPPPGTWFYSGLPACPPNASQPPAYCFGGTPPPLIQYQIGFGVVEFTPILEFIDFDDEGTQFIVSFADPVRWVGLNVQLACRCGTIGGVQRHGMVPTVLEVGDGVNEYWFMSLPGGDSASAKWGTLVSNFDSVVTIDPPLGFVVDSNGYILPGTVTLDGSAGTLVINCTT